MYRRSWMALPALAALTLVFAACSDRTTEPTPSAASADRGGKHESGALTPKLVRKLAHDRGIGRLPEPHHIRPALVELGQALVFDKILSGNRDVSCSTCHLPAFATGDGRTLSIGAGGSGFGPARTHPLGVFIPRNAPSFFNLASLKHLFWDGRVEVDRKGRFHTPAGAQVTKEMSKVFEFGPASALGMFPVTSPIEMRGSSGNELAAIPGDDFTGIWAGLMNRLGAIPEYRRMFEAAYPGQRFRDMTFANASNAIGAFLVDRVTFADSPWDRFLDGKDDALTPAQLAGAQTFLTLRCSVCHTGPTLSDDKFHDVAVVQLGPGQGNGPSLRDDFGRMNVTGTISDQYLFRTSSLRNVELTGPYGHDGAYSTLRGFVEHYSDADQKLMDYDPSTEVEAVLQPTVLTAEKAAIIAQRDTLLNGVVLSPDVVQKLLDYMSALTDDRARNLSGLIPARVPSGLPVDRP